MLKLVAALFVGVLIGFLIQWPVRAAGGSGSAWSSYEVRQALNLLQEIADNTAKK